MFNNILIKLNKDIIYTITLKVEKVEKGLKKLNQKYQIYSTFKNL